jgi:hypothetical protein
VVLNIKKKKRNKKEKKKTKEKGKTGKKTVRAAGENGAEVAVIGQGSCSSKLPESPIHIDTFPLHLIPPLYICSTLFLFFFL